MTVACSECGQPLPLRLARLGLEARLQPRAIYWRGRKLDLSPAQTCIMEVFIRGNGRGSYGALEMAATERTGGDVLKTQICNLRKRLATNGMPAKISSIRGEAYIIELRDGHA